MREIISKNLKIGVEHPCFIIAEIGQAHDGSLGTAHAYIDMVAKTGANAVKFQTHIAREESSLEEPWRVKFSYQDKTRFDYWKRMEFSEEQWIGLKKHAEECGLVFLSSPFSIAAVEMLNRIGILAWKVASGEMTNGMMIERILDTNLPVLFSTGMSSESEVNQVIQSAVRKGIPFGIMQCTSQYPCAPEAIGLNLISEYQSAYDCPCGLSDHSGSIFPSLSAVTLGANMIEVHVTFSRDCFGPDVSSSLLPQELQMLVDGIRFTEAMVKNPVDKERMAADLAAMKTLFQKSLAYSRAMKCGEILRRQDITSLKPGKGVPVSELQNILGKVLLRDVADKEFILRTDIGD